MAYAAASDVKTYLGISGSGDDDLITALIARAQRAIDSRTGRSFEVSVDTTRRFTVGKDTVGEKLLFDADICAITTVKTDADDGSGGTTVPATAYVTLPRNKTPYYGIQLLTSKNYDWTYTSDPEAGISVEGKWAYSTSPPADIVQACIRWAAYMYRQKDAQVFDTIAIPDAGVIQIPAGIPADVEKLLSPYIRPRL